MYPFEIWTGYRQEYILSTSNKIINVYLQQTYQNLANKSLVLMQKTRKNDYRLNHFKVIMWPWKFFDSLQDKVLLWQEWLFTKNHILLIKLPTLINSLVGEPERIICKFNKVTILFLYSPQIAVRIDLFPFILWLLFPQIIHCLLTRSSLTFLL